MPRPGGESDKLAACYEAVWTTDSVLDLVVGRTESLTVEPLRHGKGIEFFATASGGLTFFHSVKRQKTGTEWSLPDLTRRVSKGTRRSVLGDLTEKLRSGRNHHAVFVSSTGANQLRELCERAWRSLDSASFHRNLESSRELLRQYASHILPLFEENLDAAFDGLRRLRVVLINESELITRVDDRIASILFCADPAHSRWPTDARLHITELILDTLGQPLRSDFVRDYLAAKGFPRRLYSRV